MQAIKKNVLVNFYLAIKKKKVLPFVTVWIDLENIMLSEISQSEKDKYHMISLVWNLLNKLNKQNRDRLIESSLDKQLRRGKGRGKDVCAFSFTLVRKVTAL